MSLVGEIVEVHWRIGGIPLMRVKFSGGVDFVSGAQEATS